MNIDKYDQSTFLVLKAAYLYYLSGKPQTLIAEELGVSLTTVSRLLKRAKEEKIIEFVIRDPFVECIKVEQQLKDFLGIKEVVIAPAVSAEDVDQADEAENLKKLVALEGARYLQRIIKKGDVIGFTWGSTVYQMINYLNPAQKVEADFVTLHGSLANSVAAWDVRTLVTRSAKAFSGNKHILLTDTLMSSSEVAELLKKEKSISQVYEMFDKVNLSISGIGAFYPEMTTVLAHPDYLPPEDLKELQACGVVADVVLRFIDKDGKECNTSLKNRTISIELEQFKKIPRKITIASGTQKAYAVMAAVEGGLVDTLIIDSKLAVELLKLWKSHHLMSE